MGHLLSTVNPEAAAAIQPKVVAPKDMPSVGTVVTYFARPGEGRRGGHEFAALVTRAYDNGTIDGIAFYDADDFRNLERVPQRSEHHEYPAWDWRDDGGGEDKGEEWWPALEALRKMVGVWVEALNARMVRLENGDDTKAEFAEWGATTANMELRFQDAVAGLAKSIAPLEKAVFDLQKAQHSGVSDDWIKVAEKRLDNLERDFAFCMEMLEQSRQREVKRGAIGNLSDVEARLDALEDKRSGVIPPERLAAAQKLFAKVAHEANEEEKLRKVEAVVAGEKPKPKAKVKKRKKRRKAKRATKPLLPPASD